MPTLKMARIHHQGANDWDIVATVQLDFLKLSVGKLFGRSCILTKDQALGLAKFIIESYNQQPSSSETTK